MKAIETIGWHYYSEETGRPCNYSKTHYVEGNSNTTICGEEIPRNSDTQNRGKGDCKKCLKKLQPDVK